MSFLDKLKSGIGAIKRFLGGNKKDQSKTVSPDVGVKPRSISAPTIIDQRKTITRPDPKIRFLGPRVDVPENFSEIAKKSFSDIGRGAKKGRASSVKRFTGFLGGDKQIFRSVANAADTDQQPAQTQGTAQGTAHGTNYDPFDPKQTREDADGIGAAGVKMTARMVAVGRISLEDTSPKLPYGTIIRVLDTGQTYLVADAKNRRFHTTDFIDFAIPGSGSDIIPEFNGPIKYEVVEFGTGVRDARNKAQFFQF